MRVPSLSHLGVLYVRHVHGEAAVCYGFTHYVDGAGTVNDWIYRVAVQHHPHHADECTRRGRQGWP